MKKYLLLLALSLGMTVNAGAQRTDIYKNGVVQSRIYDADSIVFTDIPNYDTQAKAREWAETHADSLIEVAWQKVQNGTTPNKLDPDENREVLRTIGYDGRNVNIYLTAGYFVDDAIEERLIQRALAAGNTTAVLIAGNTGAGKSYSINNNPDLKTLVDNAGVVYDQSFRNREYLNRVIKRLRDRGFTNIVHVLVYNDAMTSFSNSTNRFMETGRSIALEFFLSMYPAYIGYVAKNEEEQKADRYVYIRNYSEGTGEPKVVTVEEAKQWDYTISEELKAKLLNYIYEFAKKNNMTYRDLWALLYNE